MSEEEEPSAHVPDQVAIVPDPEEGEQHDNDVPQKLTLEAGKAVFLAAIGGLLFGYNTSIVSGAMIFYKDEFNLDPGWQELVVTITILAAWICSMFAGSISDHYGRRITILMSALIFTAGGIIMGIAVNKWMLLVGRFTAGAGIGFSSVVVPVFIAEIAPASMRGSLVTANTLFCTGGQAVSSLVAVAFAYLPPAIGWRFMLGISFLPAAVQFVGFLFVSESPRWLMRKGREDEAKAVLQKIRGQGANIDEEYQGMKAGCGQQSDADPGGRPQEMQPLNEPEGTSPILSSNNQTQEQEQVNFRATLKKILSDSHLRLLLLTGCMLQAIQQLAGINTVMYYAATIVQMSGVGDKKTAVWMASATACVNFLTTFIGLYAVDRMGRRMLTLLSLSGVVISLMILTTGFAIESRSSPQIFITSSEAIDDPCTHYSYCRSCIDSDICGYCYEKDHPDNGTCYRSHTELPLTSAAAGPCLSVNSTMSEDRTWAFDFCPTPYAVVILIGLCVYLFAFGPGMGPMPWTLNSELYPMWARDTCCSIATSVNWFCNMLVSFTFLTLVRTLSKEGTFLVYTIFSAIGFVYFFWFLPETKGRNLEDTGLEDERDKDQATSSAT